MFPSIRISRKGAARLEDGHPWIFSSDVSDRGNATPGAVVKLLDPRGKILGLAHYSAASQITLRLLTARSEMDERTFLRERLQAAFALRAKLVTGTDAYRLVYSEADQLPGLIVDRYGDSLSVQVLSQGMDRWQPMILDLLEELLSPQAIVLRNDAAVRKHEELPLEKLVARGACNGPASIHMNGLTMGADLLQGQKTGVFLDQRENYAAAAKYASGAALDCFTCTGGFGLHLARVCESVEGVDSSAASLEMAESNRAANQLSNITFRQADVFELLTGYSQARRRFDLIVLDPPAFTKTREAREGAMRGYREINQRALRMLSSGGVLVTCSCSHHIGEPMLLEAIASAALDSGKTLRVLERRTQAADHPILLTVPETLYLKCLILQVV